MNSKKKKINKERKKERLRERERLLRAESLFDGSLEGVAFNGRRGDPKSLLVFPDLEVLAAEYNVVGGAFQRFAALRNRKTSGSCGFPHSDRQEPQEHEQEDPGQPSAEETHIRRRPRRRKVFTKSTPFARDYYPMDSNYFYTGVNAGLCGHKSSYWPFPPCGQHLATSSLGHGTLFLDLIILSDRVGGLSFSAVNVYGGFIECVRVHLAIYRFRSSGVIIMIVSNEFGNYVFALKIIREKVHFFIKLNDDKGTSLHSLLSLFSATRLETLRRGRRLR